MLWNFRKGCINMGKFLNSKKAAMLFKDDMESTYFVDKTALLDELLPIIDPGVPSGKTAAIGEQHLGRSSKIGRAHV